MFAFREMIMRKTWGLLVPAALFLFALSFRLAYAGCNPPLQPEFAINYSYPPYNQLPNIAGNPGLSGEGISERTAAMSNAIGAYHSTHGLSSTPPGTIFMITYQDGADEEGDVQSIYSDVQAIPVPNSFQTASEVQQCAAEESQGPGQFSGGGGSGVSGIGGGSGFTLGLGWTVGTCYDYYSNGSYIGTDCPKTL